MWENGPEFQLGITRDNGRDKAAADFDYNGYIHSHMHVHIHVHIHRQGGTRPPPTATIAGICAHKCMAVCRCLCMHAYMHACMHAIIRTAPAMALVVSTCSEIALIS